MTVNRHPINQEEHHRLIGEFICKKMIGTHSTDYKCIDYSRISLRIKIKRLLNKLYSVGDWEDDSQCLKGDKFSNKNYPLFAILYAGYRYLQDDTSRLNIISAVNYIQSEQEGTADQMHLDFEIEDKDVDEETYVDDDGQCH